MYRALLMGLFLSCTGEPAIGVNANHGDSKPVREHQIQTASDAGAVVSVLTALVREASAGLALRGVGGNATTGDHWIAFDDFELRASGGTLTLAGDLVYRGEAGHSFDLDGVIDVQWSSIADTVTLHDHVLTTAGGLTFAF